MQELLSHPVVQCGLALFAIALIVADAPVLALFLAPLASLGLPG